MKKHEKLWTTMKTMEKTMTKQWQTIKNMKNSMVHHHLLQCNTIFGHWFIHHHQIWYNVNKYGTCWVLYSFRLCHCICPCLLTCLCLCDCQIQYISIATLYITYRKTSFLKVLSLSLSLWSCGLECSMCHELSEYVWLYVIWVFEALEVNRQYSLWQSIVHGSHSDHCNAQLSLNE